MQMAMIQHVMFNDMLQYLISNTISECCSVSSEAFQYRCIHEGINAFGTHTQLSREISDGIFVNADTALSLTLTLHSLLARSVISK